VRVSRHAYSQNCRKLIKPRTDDPASSSNPGAFLSFSGDAEDELLPEGGEDVAVDLFAQAEKAVAAAEAAGATDDEKEDGEGEDDDAEPEDDFNAAWEVLDLARALFDKRQEEDDEIKLKLADTYIALGDVSLETGAFEHLLSFCSPADPSGRVLQKSSTKPSQTMKPA
jgi:HAT1-interacting factor 1